MRIAQFILFLIPISLFISSCNNSGQTNDETNETTGQNEEIMAIEPSADLLWKTDSTFSDSESTLYYARNDEIFVSCGNNSIEKDGDGFIAVLNADGSVKNKDWATGLNAPKGMAILGNNLYVTDIDEVVEIDVNTGDILNKYPVENAQFLNDAATDGSIIYFSDMRANRVYSLDTDGAIELVAENVPSINGLETHNGMLYGLNGEGLIKFDDNGGYEILTDEVKGGDGLVILNDTTFIASRWAGKIYYIDGDRVTLLVDTEAVKSNTADISYIPDEQLIIVPTFKKNEVAAYQLELGR